MIYELRKWFEDLDCLYTDDRRIKDIAMQEPDLQITSTYFRTPSAIQPFAWDIVGPPDSIGPIARRFTHREKTSSMRRVS